MARTKYHSDMVLPGMLYARFLRSPYAHAIIKGIDVSRAKLLPGVHAVVTYEDVPDEFITEHATKYVIIGNVVKIPGDRKILDQRLRFVGDYVAGVAAEDEQTAEKALGLIEVEYDELTPVFDPEEALKPSSPKLYEAGNVFNGSPEKPTLTFAKGDVKRGFEVADLVIERKYASHFQVAMPMESRCCVAEWEGDFLTMWVTLQEPYVARRIMSRVFGLPLQNVRVNASVFGGGYGSRALPQPVEFMAAMMAKMSGRPVKARLSRREEPISNHNRPETITFVKAGFKKDGTLTALDTRIIMNVGAWNPTEVGVPQHMARVATLLYARCPNISCQILVVYTNLPVGCGWRSFGSAEAIFPIEEMMDEAAGKLMIDPIELRKKNHVRTGDNLAPMFPSLNMSSVGLDTCMERGAREIGWYQRMKRGSSSERDISLRGDKAVGIGFSMGSHSGGIRRPPSNAMIEFDHQGKATLKIGTPDIGTEQATTQSQLAAETLGISVDDITVLQADTVHDVEDAGILGSRSTSSMGWATVRACRAAKRMLLEKASQMLAESVDQLDVKEGVVISKATRRSVPVPAVCSKAKEEGSKIEGRGLFTDNCEGVLGFAVGFAKVEVDLRTGKVTVLKYVNFQDAGKVVNPSILEVQMQGSVIQGLGYALDEELVYDRKTGTVLNPTFLEYHVPTFLDIPELKCVAIDGFEPLGVYGAKGAAEVGITPVAPAICNAVADALGVRSYTIPLTPRRVLEMISQKRGPAKGRGAQKTKGD